MNGFMPKAYPLFLDQELPCFRLLRRSWAFWREVNYNTPLVVIPEFRKACECKEYWLFLISGIQEKFQPGALDLGPGYKKS